MGVLEGVAAAHPKRKRLSPVELNPVRAGLVATPRDYRWSSYRSRAGWEATPPIDLDEGYLSLGATPQERGTQYRAWVRAAIPEGEWEQIREAMQRGQLTGRNRFVEDVARKIGRRVERRGRGARLINKSVPFLHNRRHGCEAVGLH